MEENNFFKFPKTPHMAGSAVVDEDESLSELEFNNLIKLSNITNIIVQEKIDGTNVSVHFQEEWQPILQKRSGLILQGERHQYNLFRDYIWSNLELFWEILGTKYCLFGEGVWQQHSVGYDELPNYFIVFDILEKETGNFVSYKKLVEIINGKLTIVPLVQHWEISNSQNIKYQTELQKLLYSKSSFGKEQQEGLYIRFESLEYVMYRCKLRRKTFVAGRQDFDKNHFGGCYDTTISIFFFVGGNPTF